MKEGEKEGESEYQLLLECRSNSQQRGEFVGVNGFCAQFEVLPVQCWQPSDCGRE